jgi:hypothetical protein
MKNILTILSLVTEHIDIFENKKDIAEIRAFIEVKEESVQEIFDTIETLGGKWSVVYNSNGNIGMYATFKTTVDSEYVKAARLINRHWFETRFNGNRGELLKYCEDILIASK